MEGKGLKSTLAFVQLPSSTQSHPHPCLAYSCAQGKGMPACEAKSKERESYQARWNELSLLGTGS